MPLKPLRIFKSFRNFKLIQEQYLTKALQINQQNTSLTSRFPKAERLIPLEASPNNINIKVIKNITNRDVSAIINSERISSGQRANGALKSQHLSDCWESIITLFDSEI